MQEKRESNLKDLNLSEEEILKRKINTIDFSVAKFIDIFRRVNNETEIKLIAEDDYDKIQCSCFVKNIEVYKVMDGLAGLFLTRWTKDGVDRYIMTDPFEFTIGWIPKNPEEIERCEVSLPFLNDYMRLPTELQKNLKDNDDIPSRDNGIPFSKLPEPMQQCLYKMMEVENKYREKGNFVSPEEILNSRITVDNESERGNIELFICVNTKNRSGGSRYSNTKYLIDNGILRPSNEKTYACKKWDIDRKEYKKVKTLQQEITLNSSYFVMDILNYLHQNFDISCVSEPQKNIPMRGRVEVSKMPLWQFLEKMPEIFPETEWEYRKSEILVVRGPRNAARDNKRFTIVGAKK